MLCQKNLHHLNVDFPFYIALASYLQDHSFTSSINYPQALSIAKSTFQEECAFNHFHLSMRQINVFGPSEVSAFHSFMDIIKEPHIQTKIHLNDERARRHGIGKDSGSKIRRYSRLNVCTISPFMFNPNSKGVWVIRGKPLLICKVSLKKSPKRVYWPVRKQSSKNQEVHPCQRPSLPVP